MREPDIKQIANEVGPTCFEFVNGTWLPRSDPGPALFALGSNRRL